MKTNPTKLFIISAIAVLIAGIGNVNGATKPSVKHSVRLKKANDKYVDLNTLKTKSVMFAFNKTDVKTAFYPDLDRVAKLVTTNNAAIKLGGHADNRGAYVYNWKLSEHRADAVKAYLVSKGVDSARIATTGFGDTKPVASNKSKSGRLKNRRVDILFVQ